MQFISGILSTVKDAKIIVVGVKVLVVVLIVTLVVVILSVIIGTIVNATKKEGYSPYTSGASMRFATEFSAPSMGAENFVGKKEVNEMADRVRSYTTSENDVMKSIMGY